MSLDSIKKSFNLEKYDKYSDQKDKLDNISSIIEDISNVRCRVKVSSNKLYLTTSSSAAASELRLYNQQIILKVNEYLESLSSDLIKTVIVKIA